MTEEWRAIPEFPKYEVSDQGNVRVLKKGGHYRILAQHPIESGYMRVNLWSEQTGHTKKLTHVLVCRTFHGQPPVGDVLYEVNHKDGIKSHNTPGNLEWKTGSGNVQHALETGLTRYNLRIIVCDTETGQVVSYPSMNAVAREFNTTPEVVKRILGHPDKNKFKDRYTFDHVMSEHEPAHRTKDKIVAFDHTTGIRIIGRNGSELSILTGVLSTTILNTLKKGDLDMVAGYSFKWFKDPRAVPSFTSEEAMVSRVNYFLRKPRTEGIWAKNHQTGVERFFEDIDELVTVTGVVENSIRTMINLGSLIPFKGYSFKRSDNENPFPTYNEDQIAASLVRKGRGAMPYKVTDRHTGQISYYGSLKDVAEFYGWSRSATKAWLDKYPGIPYLTKWLVESINLD